MEMVNEKTTNTKEVKVKEVFKTKSDAFIAEYSEDVHDVAKCIVDVLKEKELTYENAYAALNMAYEIINFESRFLRLAKR